MQHQDKNPKLETRNSKLSKIIAGTMTWGNWGKQFSASQMIDIMTICIENGITTFDHADIYGGYTTESQFGKAFGESLIEREKIQLISKCGIQHTEGRDNRVKHYNYSKEYITWSVENSLQNLKTDYLDVLLLHRPSPLMIADEITEVVEKLKQEGKIIDFGVSNFTSSQTELVSQKTKVSYNQIQFSVTHHEAMLNGSLDFMQVNGIQPMSWNPLGSYFKETTEQTQRLKKCISQLSEKYQVGEDSILLAWILKHPAKVLPVIGTANKNRIKEAMQAVQLVLDPIDWFEIWSESMGNKVP